MPIKSPVLLTAPQLLSSPDFSRSPSAGHHITNMRSVSITVRTGRKTQSKGAKNIGRATTQIGAYAQVMRVLDALNGWLHDSCGLCVYRVSSSSRMLFRSCT